MLNLNIIFWFLHLFHNILIDDWVLLQIKQYERTKKIKSEAASRIDADVSVVACMGLIKWNQRKDQKMANNFYLNKISQKGVFL